MLWLHAALIWPPADPWSGPRWEQGLVEGFIRVTPSVEVEDCKVKYTFRISGIEIALRTIKDCNEEPTIFYDFWYKFVALSRLYRLTKRFPDGSHQRPYGNDELGQSRDPRSTPPLPGVIGHVLVPQFEGRKAVASCHFYFLLSFNIIHFYSHSCSVSRIYRCCVLQFGIPDGANGIKTTTQQRRLWVPTAHRCHISPQHDKKGAWDREDGG